MMNDYKTVDGDDILSNSIRAIKQYIPRKIEEVENEPTGARYWITTQELRDIIER